MGDSTGGRVARGTLRDVIGAIGAMAVAPALGADHLLYGLLLSETRGRPRE